MLKAYSNRLLELLKARGLDPVDFQSSRTESDGKTIFALTLRGTPLAFQFWAVGADSFESKYCQYRSMYVGGYPHAEYSNGAKANYSFPSLELTFRHWLDSVKKYKSDQAIIAKDQTTPDL